MSFARGAGTVWRYEWLRLVAGGRVAALGALWLLGSGIVAYAFFQGAGAGTSVQASDEGAAALTAQITGYSLPTVQAMVLDGLPLRVPMVFSLLCFGLPILCALVGFDQIAGQLRARSLRYPAVRARRDALFLGGFLARLTLVLALALVAVAILVAEVKVAAPTVTLSALGSWGLKLAGAACAVAFAWSAFAAIFSCIASSGATALMLTLLGVVVAKAVRAFGSMLAAAAGDGAVGGPVSWVRFLVPSQYEPWLVSPDLREATAGVAAVLALGGLGLGAALAAFVRRDL